MSLVPYGSRFAARRYNPYFPVSHRPYSSLALSLARPVVGSALSNIVPAPLSAALNIGSFAVDAARGIYKAVSRFRRGPSAVQRIQKIRKSLQAIKDRKDRIPDDAGAAQREVGQGDAVDSEFTDAVEESGARLNTSANQGASTSGVRGIVNELIMPRTYRRRRGYARGPMYFSRRSFRPGWSSQARLRRRIRRTFRPELKYYDTKVQMPATPTSSGGFYFGKTFNTAADANTTANLVHVNPIPRGTGPSERIGDKVVMKVFSMKLCISSPTGSVGSTSYFNCIRVVVFLDRQCNGAAPAITDLYDHTTSMDPALAPNRLSNKLRFKIIVNRMFTMHGGTNGNAYYMEVYKIFKKGVPVWWTGSAGDITATQTNALWVAFIDDKSNTNATDAIATKVYVDTFLTRIRYIDP